VDDWFIYHKYSILENNKTFEFSVYQIEILFRNFLDRILISSAILTHYVKPRTLSNRSNNLCTILYSKHTLRTSN
jgi:hypothetical protein